MKIEEDGSSVTQTIHTECATLQILLLRDLNVVL